MKRNSLNVFLDFTNMFS